MERVSDRTSKLRLGDPGDGDWTWNRWVSQWIDCATRPVRPWHQCTWAELLLVSQVKLTQLKDPCQLLSCKFLTLCMVVSTNTIKYIYHLHILYIILYYNLPVQTALPCALTEDFPVLSCQQLFGTGSFPGMAKAQRPSSQGHECCNQHSCRFLGIAQATNDMFWLQFWDTTFWREKLGLRLTTKNTQKQSKTDTWPRKHAGQVITQYDTSCIKNQGLYKSTKMKHGAYSHSRVT